MMATNNKITELKNWEEKLEQEIARARKKRPTLIIVGIIFCIIILTYFTVMASLVRSAMEPTDVALMVSDKGISLLPDLRKELEASARQEIPLLVNEGMQELMNEAIPEIRTGLEREILISLDMGLNEAKRMFSEEIDRVLKEHGEDLRLLAKDLTTEGGTKALEDALYDSCVEVLEIPQIKDELLGARVALLQIDGAVYYLSQARETFSEREKTVKELLGVLRELLDREQTQPVVGQPVFP